MAPEIGEQARLLDRDNSVDPDSYPAPPTAHRFIKLSGDGDVSEQEQLLSAAHPDVSRQASGSGDFQPTPALEAQTVRDSSSADSASAFEELSVRRPAAPQQAELSCSGKDHLLCRICFEEDTAANLIQPCACTGTQQYVHHACVQRWVSEKGHVSCEVCQQQYSGAFDIPPPRPPPVERLILIRVDDPVARAAAQELQAQQMRAEGRAEVLRWAIFLVIGVIMYLVLHAMLPSQDPADVAPSGPGSGAGWPSGSGSGTGAPVGGGGQGDVGGTSDDASAADTTIVIWVLSKLILMVGLPIYLTMRIIAKQQDDEALEARLAAGEQAGQAGAPGHVVLQVVRADQRTATPIQTV